MATRDSELQGGSSIADALATMQLIDMALDAICNTAPKAVAEMGGRDVIKDACQMTCVGPVPRLDAKHWQAMSMEYVDRVRYDGYVQGVGAGPNPPAGPGARTPAGGQGLLSR